MSEYRNRIVCADATEFLRTLPDGSVNCCVTSPPYWNLRDYSVDGQIGLEQTPAEYTARLVGVFREVRRVLRDDGTLFVNLGDTYDASKSLVGIPWRFALAMIDDGWILRNDIIWGKRNPMPESATDRLTKAHEYVFFFVKQPRYWSDMYAVREEAIYAGGVVTLGDKSLSRGQALGANVPMSGNAVKGSMTVGTHRNARDVWMLSSEPSSAAHYATMPSKLVEKCLLIGCPEKVCPACGAPWTRVTERHATRTNPSEALRQRERNAGARSGGTNSVTLGVTSFVQLTDLGVHPSCTCDQPPIPGLALDPFMGSGTTARTALRLRRDFTGCDLNPAYTTLALSSLDNLQPHLFLL